MQAGSFPAASTVGRREMWGADIHARRVYRVFQNYNTDSKRENFGGRTADTDGVACECVRVHRNQIFNIMK